MSKPIRILRVEDNTFDRGLVRHTLEKEQEHGGFKMITIPTLIEESKMPMMTLVLSGLSPVRWAMVTQPSET